MDQLYSALIFSAKSKLFYIIFGVVFYGDNTDGFVKIKGEIRISEHLKKSRIIDLKTGNRIAKQIKKHWSKPPSYYDWHKKYTLKTELRA